MMHRLDYYEEKFAHQQDLRTTFHVHEVDGQRFDLQVTRLVDPDMPEAVRRRVGDVFLDHRESWWPDGDGYAGAISADMVGRPVHTSGTMRIIPAAPGAEWSVDFTITAKVPVVGKKVESIVASQMRTTMALEFEFNRTWLAREGLWRP